MRRRWRASAMWHNPRQLNLLAAALTAGATLALCAALGHWLMRQPMFALRVIRIDGDLAHLNLPSVRAAVSQLRNRRLYTHFFNLDLEETRAIFEAMPWVQRAALREARRRSLRVTGILRAGLRRLAWRLSRSAFRSGAPGQWSCRTERALSWAAIKKEKGEAMQARLRRAAMVSSSAAGGSPLPGRQSPRNGERRFKGSICAIRMDLPF